MEEEKKLKFFHGLIIGVFVFIFTGATTTTLLMDQDGNLISFWEYNNQSKQIDYRIPVQTDGVIRNDNAESLVGVYNELPIETHTEHAIFEGRGYVLSGRATMSTGSSIYLQGCAQDKAIHFENFVLDLSATPFDVNFYESPTITNNGTQIYGKNTERNFADNHSLILFYDSTFTHNGTFIQGMSAYGGNNLIGSVGMPSEFILKINTCYLFEITNNDGNNVDITYNFLWHESENNYTYYFP